jgi:phosphoribosyl-AMP cyclohydrolase
MKKELKPRYNAQGLVPVIVQDVESKYMLMLAWMNEEAFHLTLKTGLVHFWSRSRQELWLKGATSGNYLHLVEMSIDCDEDTLLVLVHADGPACHTGETSCFFRNVPFEPSPAKSN